MTWIRSSFNPHTFNPHTRGLTQRRSTGLPMTLQQRVTTLYTELFHIPDLEKPEDAREYRLLQTALREMVQDCKRAAEQHALGGAQSPWGDGLRHAANKIAFPIERDVGNDRRRIYIE